jgi:hypothetical protein
VGKEENTIVDEIFVNDDLIGRYQIRRTDICMWTNHRVSERKRSKEKKKAEWAELLKFINWVGRCC